jgi:DNA-binding transcriptional ArsR family regulator
LTARVTSTGKSKSMPRSQGKTAAGVDRRLVKALSHTLRERILIILNERVASPNELSKELGEGLSQVSYHVKVLRDYECIELVKTEPRRGAVEHYYRATSRPFLTDRDWSQIPDSVRHGLSADFLELVFGDAVAALEGGTLERRTDRHTSRTPLALDEEGWEELTAALNETLDRVLEIERKSAGRLARAGAKGFNALVAIMGFELSATSRKADRRAKV